MTAATIQSAIEPALARDAARGTPVFDLQRLTYAYDRHIALREVNISVYPGSYDALGRTIFVAVTLKD